MIVKILKQINWIKNGLTEKGKSGAMPRLARLDPPGRLHRVTKENEPKVHRADVKKEDFLSRPVTACLRGLLAPLLSGGS
jgi:hypothetical protein